MTSSSTSKLEFQGRSLILIHWALVRARSVVFVYVVICRRETQ